MSAEQTKPEAAKPSEEKKHPSGMTLDERFKLVRSIGAECIQEAELRALLDKHPWWRFPLISRFWSGISFRKSRFWVNE
eukprot:703342-Amorphochlora_amoeboformis.AAC.1